MIRVLHGGEGGASQMITVLHGLENDYSPNGYGTPESDYLICAQSLRDAPKHRFCSFFEHCSKNL